MDPDSSEPSRPEVRRYRRAVGTAAILTVELYDERAAADPRASVGEVAPDDDVGVDAQTAPIVDHDRLGRLALHALALAGAPATQVDVTLVDTARMADLNREHMGADGPTDVLAFPLDVPVGTDGPAAEAGVPSLLGDVVLCPEVAWRQAADAGHPPAAELDLILVHGVLHLLGHDHAGEGERTVMFGLTDDILADFHAAEAAAGAPGASSGGRRPGGRRLGGSR